MQTLQSPGSNGSAFLCNQDLGQVLNLVFFPDRVIEVEHQPATDEAPRRIAGDRQIVRCEPVGAFWGENEPVLTLELGPDWLPLNYLLEDISEERRGVYERVSTWRSRWSTSTIKKTEL